MSQKLPGIEVPVPSDILSRLQGYDSKAIHFILLSETPLILGDIYFFKFKTDE